MKFSEIINRDKTKNSLIFLSSIAVFFPIFQPFIYVLLLYFIVTAEYNFTHFFHTRKSISYWFLLLYMLWGIFTLLYSDNFKEGVQQVVKTFPFLLISILFCCSQRTQKVNFELVQRYYYWAACLFVLSCYFVALYDYLFGCLQGEICVYGKGNIDILGYIGHRSYASCLLLMTFPYLFGKLFSAKLFLERAIAFVSLLLFIFTIYISGGRIAFVIVIFLSFFLLVYHGYSYLSFKLFLLLTLFFISSLTVFFVKSPRVAHSIVELKNGKTLEESDDRGITWMSTLQIINENFLLGVGVGDAQDNLNEIYKKNGFESQANRNLNVHNQYLQILLERGLIGLSLFFVFLIIWVVEFSSFYRIHLLSFLLIYGLSFIFESMFLRNLAIFPFVFWLLMFSVDKKDGVELRKVPHESLLIGLLLLLIVGISLLFFTRKIVFDSSFPRTYSTIDYQLVPYKELPVGHNFGIDTEAVKLDAPLLELKNYENGEFIMTEVFKFSKNVHSPIRFTVWCYLTKDSNFESVYGFIYKENVTYQRFKYDMLKKGTWQKLVIDIDQAQIYTSVGIRLNVSENQSVLGAVYYALPEILY